MNSLFYLSIVLLSTFLVSLLAIFIMKLFFLIQGIFEYVKYCNQELVKIRFIIEKHKEQQK